MSSAIFTNGNESYQVTNIIYAGSVAEIPEERRRNGNTHSFKIITGARAGFAYYKDVDTARKARGVLAGMLDGLRPKAFKNGSEYLDASRVVSFSSVVAFKKPLGDYTHGYVVTVDTVEEKSREIWFRFKSEDHACKSRKALWATVHTVNGLASAPRVDNKAPVNAVAAVSEAVPF